MTPRCRPGFDALEGRQLLSAGQFPTATVEEFTFVGPPGLGFDPGPVQLSPVGGLSLNLTVVDGPSALGQFELPSHEVMAPNPGPGEAVISLWASPMGPAIGAPGPMMLPPTFSTAGGQGSVEVFGLSPSSLQLSGMKLDGGFRPEFATDTMSSGGLTPVAFLDPAPGATGNSTTAGDDWTNPGPAPSPTTYAMPIAAPNGGANPFGAPADGFDDQMVGTSSGRPQSPAEMANSASPAASGLQPGWNMPRIKVELIESGFFPSVFANSYIASSGSMSSVGQQGFVAALDSNQSVSGATKGTDTPLAQLPVNAPVEPKILADSDGLAVTTVRPSGGFQERGIGAGLAEPGRVPGVMGYTSNAMGAQHGSWWSPRGEGVGLNAGLFPESPDPRGVDLIAEAFPFARESLESALEDFVGQLGGADLGLFEAQRPSPIVMLTVGLLTSVLSAELVRRDLQRRAARNRRILAIDPSGRQYTLGFPELPGSRSERRP